MKRVKQEKTTVMDKHGVISEEHTVVVPFYTELYMLQKKLKVDSLNVIYMVQNIFFSTIIYFSVKKNPKHVKMGSNEIKMLSVAECSFVNYLAL